MKYRVIMVRHFDDGYGPRRLGEAATYDEALSIAHQYSPTTVGKVYVQDLTNFPHTKVTLVKGLTAS